MSTQPASTQPPRPGAALLGLAAAGLLAFTPFVARAQTQDLFVASQASNSILRFAGTGSGTFSTTSTTLASGVFEPAGLAFDARGDLFADSQANSVTEFPVGAVSGTFTASVTLTDPSLDDPIGLAVDPRGDLFVANQISGTGVGRITEFLAGTVPGTFGSVTTLTIPGVNQLQGLTFDARGDLFASNLFGGNNRDGSVTEFPVGAITGTFGAPTTLTAADGLNYPVGLAADAQGNLFVADETGSSITEFASTGAGTFGTSKVIKTGLNRPNGLAFNANGDLFVADYGTSRSSSMNSTDGNVTEFASTGVGTFGAGQPVETHQSDLTFLAFGPPAPVPEASTTVSFGLLVLGIGGLMVAARRKKSAP